MHGLKPILLIFPIYDFFIYNHIRLQIKFPELNDKSEGQSSSLFIFAIKNDTNVMGY